MIDLSRERPISFNQAAELLPENYRPNTSTWWRWGGRGIKGVRLETVYVGGRRYTTAEALQRFFDSITAASNGAAAPIRTTTENQRAIANAERELREADI